MRGRSKNDLGETVGDAKLHLVSALRTLKRGVIEGIGSKLHYQNRELDELRDWCSGLTANLNRQL